MRGIVHLVASSVSDLEPERVTVVDQNGRLLTQNGEEDRFASDDERLEYSNQLEQRYVVVGMGNSLLDDKSNYELRPSIAFNIKSHRSVGCSVKMIVWSAINMMSVVSVGSCGAKDSRMDT